MKAALSTGVTREEMARTVSCYSGDGFCGQCSSCFKRAVATKLNGWVEDYAVHPFSTDTAYRALVAAAQGGYPPRRCEEIKSAMDYDGDLVGAIDRLKGLAGKKG